MDKHPKSTRYGRQNPISARWNSEEQLLVWREAWATAANRCLELAGHDSRIDHRSHAERDLEERPTIHEGVAAQALELRGIISDRCELNQKIKADNALLRELRGQVQSWRRWSKPSSQRLPKPWRICVKICCCSVTSWDISTRARNA